MAGSPELTYYKPEAGPEKNQNSRLSLYMSHFDFDWERQGLSRDWYNLHTKDKKTIGFSMKGQMDILQNSSDKQAISEWTQKTKRDLIGFKLEYLSDHIVFPCSYERGASDPTRLEDKQYDNKDMVEITSDQERGGSVKRSLQDMKEFFLSEDTPDGSIAIMASPMGDSGFKADNGEKITYPDSYFFIMQKNGNKVENFTLKTDFTLQESREAIYRLTGKRLSPTDSIEEYVGAVAKIKPGEHKSVEMVSDVIGVLEKVRPSHAFEDSGAFKQTGWEEVYKDIREGEKLYDFNEKTQQIIEDFESYCLEGNHSKLELQKAIAATILRMSKLFFTEKKTSNINVDMLAGKWSQPGKEEPSFGAVLAAAASRPGCAGGGGAGKTVAVESAGGVRLGVVGPSGGEKSKTLKCKKCPQCGAKDIVATIENGTITCPNGCSSPYEC